MTGRYPHRNGLFVNIRNNEVNYGHRFTEAQYQTSPEMILGLDLREITIAQVLKAAGYYSGIFGKWDSGRAHRCGRERAESGFRNQGHLVPGAASPPGGPAHSNTSWEGSTTVDRAGDLADVSVCHMIQLSNQHLRLEKRVPLTISRGTEAFSDLLWLRLAADGVEGWGEAVPFSVDGIEQTLGEVEAALVSARNLLASLQAEDAPALETALDAAGLPSAARAAIDQALWDWRARRAGVPVWRLWGLESGIGPATSVTIGISSPEAAQRRVGQWLEVGDIRAFKIKLGSRAGIAADQRMFSAVAEVLPAGAAINVDANGGWSADDARTMSRWLAERGVGHLEQPLPRGREVELAGLRRHSPLPVILDESVFISDDLVALAEIDALDGINVKLMKCGGPSEARRMIVAARGRGLKILLGCYGNSTLANTAAAHLGSAVDFLDLDSHLNLKDDPFAGARLEAGRLTLADVAGFGVAHAHRQPV